MKSSTTDHTEGKVHEIKGDAKEKVGELTGDPELTKEGQDESLAGTVQKKVGDIKKVFGQ